MRMLTTEIMLERMKRFLITTLLSLMAVVACPQLFASAAKGDSAKEELATDGGKEKINAKDIIFEHLGDGYGWEVPFNHHKRIPLPVIVKGSKGWKVFSSGRITHGDSYVAPDGSIFKIAGEDSDYKGKVVEMVNDEEVRPIDLSVTKNVCAIFISVFVVLWMILGLARFHKGLNKKGPRKGTGAVEALVMFVYDGIIKPTLGAKAPKFAPYLLTVFVFILVMNLLGLIVIFPGGANLTGNIAVTMVLALFTFFITNLFANKHYWKEIFWPDVPLLLKFPLPIMPLIELFGIFTKPAALTVRLFANMMGGHMIVIVLTLLIFIFAAIGGAAMGGGTAVVSILFSVFMLLIDVLVSFIQAYVFTTLSTLFIGLAQEESHEKKGEVETPSVASVSTIPDATSKK